jgi:pyruvate formate lyase activating enzyme
MKGTDHQMSRRGFLRASGQTLCMLALGNGLLSSCKDSALFSLSDDEYFIKPAKHWIGLKGKLVQCKLCPNECTIEEGERGICRVRKNIGGKLYTIVYSRIAAMHVDPIEKKPLYHFLPGSMAFSIATAGCNLSCKFCQNWQLSQSRPEELNAIQITPSELSRKSRSSGTRIIAYTYNEPTIQYEYILDSSIIARENGIRSVIISNGYIQKKASMELSEHLDGIKIDLKAFTDKFYRDICGGDLKSVLKNLETVYSSGRWLEIVVLIIPTLNDSPQEIRDMTRWVKRNLSPDIPMHFTRFHSMYLIRNLPPTPVSTLERCRTIAKEEGIRYPYVGNVMGHQWENTFCHVCNKLLIKRSGFFHVESSIRNGRCPSCKTKIPGVWI